MKYDDSLTKALREKLDGLDLSGFVAPTEPEIRTAKSVRDVLRPSNMHRCERALTLTIRALPFTSTTPVVALVAMNFGTHVHRKIQAALPDLVHEKKVKGPWLCGSMDTQDGSIMGIDWKTINRKGFLQRGAKQVAEESHALQSSWYARHAGLPQAGVVYIGKPPDGSPPEKLDTGKNLVAFSADVDTSEPHPYDLKLERIRAHHKAQSLPPYVAMDECRWCLVRSECWARMPVERELHTKLVGHYAANDPERLASALATQEGDRLELIWESTNDFGPRLSDDETKAAAVMVLHEGRHIGYLPATDSPTADQVARHLRNGGQAIATVTQCTGTDAESGRNTGGRNLMVLLSE